MIDTSDSMLQYTVLHLFEPFYRHTVHRLSTWEHALSINHDEKGDLVLFHGPKLTGRERTWRKMKVNGPGRSKLGLKVGEACNDKNFFYPSLLQDLKGEHLSVLSGTVGTSFLHPLYPAVERTDSPY